jgi:photosystem II stability/assembly factor-like uncharacterized protein
MKTFLNGSLAVAALCATLAACGGGGGDSPPPPPPPTPPTALPTSVAIHNDARVEAGKAEAFATDITTTTGLTFRWDFGDGSTGTGASPSHAYAKPGTYAVTLAVANTADDIRTTTTSVQVGAYANVAGLTCSQPDSAGWCWQHAIVTGHQINSVFYVDASHAWAVGDGLTLLKSADAGATWTPVALDPALAVVSLVNVRFYDALHGLVTDNQGGGLLTQDGGVTWTYTNFGRFNGYFNPMTIVDFSARRIIVQPTSYGTAWMSVDGGATWTSVGINGTLQPTTNDCWSLNSGQLARATGCGATLDVVLSSTMSNGYASFIAAAFPSDSRGLVIGTATTYSPTYAQVSQGWETTDGGTTWTPFTPTGLSPYWYGLALQMNDVQNGVLYTPGDLTLYSTANGGHDWTLVTSSPALSPAYSYGYRATGVTGAATWQSAGNRLALSTNLGQAWQDVIVHDEDVATPAGQTGTASVVQFTDANSFVVAISHRFYVTADGGKTFRRVLGPDPRDAAAAFAAGEFSDIHNGHFLTSNGALLSTTDGGRTWTRTDYTNYAGYGVGLHFTSASEGWLVLGGKLAHSTDGGTTWNLPLVASSMANLQGMTWGDATHGWVWNAALFYTADGGVTWSQAVLPNNSGVQFAAMTGPLTGVATVGYGPVAITQDGGATWQTGGGAGTFGTLVHTSGQTVWSLANPLQRSKDGGRTWQAIGLLLNGPYNVSATGLSFADDLHGWLVTNAGGVLRTVDGGDTWTSQPVGTDLVPEAVVAVDTMTAWIITRNGQVLATATSGE